MDALFDNKVFKDCLSKATKDFQAFLSDENNAAGFQLRNKVQQQQTEVSRVCVQSLGLSILGGLFSWNTLTRFAKVSRPLALLTSFPISVGILSLTTNLGVQKILYRELNDDNSAVVQVMCFTARELQPCLDDDMCRAQFEKGKIPSKFATAITRADFSSSYSGSEGVNALSVYQALMSRCGRTKDIYHSALKAAQSELVDGQNNVEGFNETEVESNFYTDGSIEPSMVDPWDTSRQLS